MVRNVRNTRGWEMIGTIHIKTKKVKKEYKTLTENHSTFKI